MKREKITGKGGALAPGYLFILLMSGASVPPLPVILR